MFGINQLMFGINQLGAAVGSVSPGGDAEWNAYFSGLRKHVNAKWTSVVGSYNTLKAVRETLGLPFIVSPGGEGGSAVGAWSNDLEQQAVNLHGMVVLITGALDDVVSGKRKVATNEAAGGWVVESLPTDVLRLEVKAPGIPTLVNAQTGAPENVQGTVSAIWALAIAGTVVTVGAIYLAVRAIESMDSMMKEKSTQTIAKRNGELIASGKATPEQVSALTKAEGQAATDLAKARAEEKNAGDGPEKWSPLVKTLVWGGVAIGALIIAAKLIPSRSGGLAANPLKTNAIVRDTTGSNQYGSYRLRHKRGGEFEVLNTTHGYVHAGFIHQIRDEKNRFGKIWHWESSVTGDRGVSDTKSRAIFNVMKSPNLPKRSGNPMWGGKWLSPFDREAPPATRGARKYHLTRVYLNRGGYTSSGRYFGIGKPLYEYSSTDGEVHGYLRASSRTEAKKHLAQEQGGALFFNPLGLRAINSLSPMMLASIA